MKNSIFNKTEQDERAYLEYIKQKLTEAIDETHRSVDAHAKDILQIKEYLWENKAELDNMEKMTVHKSIAQSVMMGEGIVAKKKRLGKLLKTPWFGRIDFKPENEEETIPLYIGVHSYFDTKLNQNLIHDWRAPVAGMFYDFEIGPAYFESPMGKTQGDISLKRQYRIRNGRMEFMLETSLNIHDDILQKELAQTSDDRMKNIVATIQRDQNMIIRNEKSPVLIIQGVAGSGKTSIALHRIAFLLYRNAQTITSQDILIISPNKVFADYISNVLPELGEEKIREKGMEELAGELLEHKYKFRSFFDQVTQLLEKPDPQLIGRIRFKSSFEIINKLNEYLLHIENNTFKPVDIIVRRYPVPAWFFEERFRAYHRLPLHKRLPAIVRDTAENINIYYRYEVSAAERNEITKAVTAMLGTTNLRNLYKEFYTWLGKPELLKQAKGTVYEYADVFPLIYLKIHLEGIKPYSNVKHLLVDEMQDYTPVQYHVISKIFPCKKTLLGDSNQAVNPYSASTQAEISKVFTGADSMKLTKSYRSTFEITQFAQHILPNNDLEAIRRYGEPPVVEKFKNAEDELEAITLGINKFKMSGYNTLGIICKKQKQSELIHKQLKSHGIKANLLTFESITFHSGIVITTPHLAKGLEFDQVIVPFCTTKNYATNMDRHLLYVACTRAMHNLHVTAAGSLSPLIQKAADSIKEQV
jgi:DNA helicase II / ATP-dependent DNA helicase PcrA